MPSASPKVLRVALVRDGRVLTERLLDPEQSLTIGSDATNAIGVADSAFGRCTTLMTSNADGYDLHGRPDLRGKVTVGGNPRSPTGDSVLSLNQNDRGKLVLGDVTVLFQFVSPPPAAGRFLNQPLDFRPQLMDDDDPVFVGAVGVLTAMAAMLLGFVYVSPAPAHAAVIGVEQRMAHVMAQAPVFIAPEETPDSDATPKPVDEPEPAPYSEPGEGPGSGADDATPLGEDVDDEPVSLWTSIIGSTGPGANTDFARITGEVDEGATDIDRVLRQVDGVRVAQGIDSSRTIDGPGGRGEDVDIDDLRRLRAGPVDLDEETLAQPTATMDFLIPEPDPTVSDAEGIRQTVEGAKGRLEACYDRALKRDPTVQGRVEVEFYVSGGRAAQAQVFADTTGDAELGACLTTAFRRMRFPTRAEGEVLYPLVFAPSR